MHPLNKHFAARTTDGSSTATDWYGGPLTAVVTGTPDGASVAVDYSPDGGSTYVALPSMTFANTTGHLNAGRVPTGKVRLTVSSAGASTSLSGWIG